MPPPPLGKCIAYPASQSPFGADGNYISLTTPRKPALGPHPAQLCLGKGRALIIPLSYKKNSRQLLALMTTTIPLTHIRIIRISSNLPPPPQRPPSKTAPHSNLWRPTRAGPASIFIFLDFLSREVLIIIPALVNSPAWGGVGGKYTAKDGCQGNILPTSFTKASIFELPNYPLRNGWMWGGGVGGFK